MKYIFEDDGRSPLCKVFESQYDKSIVSNFIYTNGVGNICKILDTLAGKEDDIYVFMDLVPDNDNTRTTYIRISKYRKKFAHLLIIPLLCREYCYLKSLVGTEVVSDTEAYNYCIEKRKPSKSPIIHDERDRKFVKNLESLCKLTVRKALLPCGTVKGNEVQYLDKDCRCHEDIACKQDIKASEKTKRYMSEFRCIPSGIRNGIIRDTITRASWDDCVKIHRSLVDEYNDYCIKHGIVNEKTKLTYHINYMY